MTVVHVEDLFYPTIVSLLAALQLGRFARRVGEARGRYKIPVPRTDGDPNFLRTFRAQQNSHEFYPIFMTLLWTSSIFLHHAIPSVFGLLYLYARHKYFYGYSKASEKRLPGFRLSVLALWVLLGLSIAGMSLTGYTKYTGEKMDVSFYHKKTLELAKPVLGRVNSTYKRIHKACEPHLKSLRKNSRKAMEKIVNITEHFLNRLQLYAKIAYAKASYFSGKVAEKLIEIYHVLEDYFLALKTKYIQQPTKQEL